MPRHLLLVVLVLLGPGVAAAAPPPEALVGTWRGAARWKACTFGGARRVSVELRRIDRRTEIDLGGADDGLGVVALNDTAEGAMAGTRDDLEVAMAWSKKGATLTLRTASGCVATATLRRDTTGMADCDAHRALAAIAAGCSAMGDTRAEVAERAAERSAGWARARGSRRAAAAAQCRDDAAELRTALVRATCVPDPAQAGVSGIAECDAYAAVFARYLRCNQVPAAAKQASQQGFAALLESMRGAAALGPDARRAIAEACTLGADALRQSAAALGCDLR